MKVATSIILARRRTLAQMLEKHRYLPLVEVCSQLSISPATARRDLKILAAENKITRTYGGALGAFDATFASFADRRGMDRQIKEQVARKARDFIKENTTCFFDSGTTIFALAEILYREPVIGLRAVTNSLPVAEMLGRSEIEVHLLGGRFLQRQSILLGSAARRSARLWRFDQAFLGAEGFSRGGIWASEPEVASFQKSLIAQAKQVIVCAHAVKLGRETGVFLTPWKANFHLVSDLSPVRRFKNGLPA